MSGCGCVWEAGCSAGVGGSVCVCVCCGMVCVCLSGWLWVCLSGRLAAVRVWVEYMCVLCCGVSVCLGGWLQGRRVWASLCLCGVLGECAGRCDRGGGGWGEQQAGRRPGRVPASPHSGWADSRAEKKTRRQGNQSETNRFPLEVRKSRCCGCWWPVRL